MSKEDIQSKMFSDPLMFYTALLKDIKQAKKNIYIEIYRFRNDPFGVRVRDNLLKKCKEGVEIKLLIDSWGASSSYGFFQDLVEAGAELRFFKKLKLNWDGFTKGHRRNHRKIIIIDEEITYIGSANISGYSMNWRESIFRIKGDIAKKFIDVFYGNYRIYNKYFYDKVAYTKLIKHENLEIIRDVPSLIHQPVQKKYLELINKAKKEIVIETPYFLPGANIRKALMDAGERGVSVTVIIPKKSDVHALDILTTKYLGELSQHKVKIYFFLPQNLHSKIFLMDRKSFVIGSSNFDYRSFRYMHEICLAGENKSLIRQIVNHVNQTLESSEAFNYVNWKKRPFMQRFFELILVPFRHLF